MIWIITSPERIHEEERIIAALLSAGASRVLLRKPDWPMEQYRALLDKINPDCYDRILIRDQPTLAVEYGLAGVHWSKAARTIYETLGKQDKTNGSPSPANSPLHNANTTLNVLLEAGECGEKNIGDITVNVLPTTTGCSEKNTAGTTTDIIFPTEKHTTSSTTDIILPVESSRNNAISTPSIFKKSLTNSTGIHSASAITFMNKRYDTLLLSPVFNSISKPGYHGRAGGMLTNKDNRPVLALGGVDPTNIILLKQWQFDGAALLGAIWKTPAKAVENYYRIQQLWNKSDLTL